MYHTSYGKRGEIALSFDDSITHKLSAIALKEKKAEFGWITTGDNDPASDCQHMDVEFDIEIEYINQ